jgi:hypothetical protein
MDMTTLEKPHSTEISVMEEGSAYFERCVTLMRFTLRLALLSSGLSFLFMARLSDAQLLMIANK